MNNDGVSFVLLCAATRGTYHQAIALGVILVGVGVGTKLWARATLGSDAYYWYDFFAPARTELTRRGPYRWLHNPMYTVGYLQTYGLALIAGSLPGLVASAFDQLAILVFHRLVEHPHVHARHGAGATSRSPGM
jgi:protein-S-isoprenylcysteine O-methyltransferase Ste14